MSCQRTFFCGCFRLSSEHVKGPDSGRICEDEPPECLYVLVRAGEEEEGVGRCKVTTCPGPAFLFLGLRTYVAIGSTTSVRLLRSSMEGEDSALARCGLERGD